MIPYPSSSSPWLLCLLAVSLATTPPPSKAQEIPLRAVPGHDTVTFAEDLKVSRFADGNQIRNVTAFSFDDQGRMFAAETHRHRVAGVTDNRENHHWITEDAQSTSVDDRVEMIKRHTDKRPLSYYQGTSEKIRMIADTTGDGKADQSIYFADSGFDDIPHGVAAGILALNGKVYFACIPGVYLLEDTTNDGKADKRNTLHHGFGLHVSLSGHDLNGFVPGPDGRIYFSLGDRGMNVTTMEGRQILLPGEGAILRMERDGSQLEVIHRGLRNPKEIDWNNSGDWFSVDNDADMVDRARVVAIQWGANSGWHMGYQNLNNFWEIIGLPERPANPWTDENIWTFGSYDKRPDLFLPPIDFLTNGPSGFVFNPGATLLPPAYDDHYFICDYKGGAANSFVYAFQINPDGAQFTVENARPISRGVAPTDVDFAPDGRLYISDYIGGWTIPNNGNIWVAEGNVSDQRKQQAQSAEQILNQGVGTLQQVELINLLAHPNRRVRLRAQYELADRGPESIPSLTSTLTSSNSFEQRIHTLWTLGMLARINKADSALTAIRTLLNDPHPDLRRNAITTLAEAADHHSIDAIASLMTSDPDAAVRRDAALAIGRIGNASALDATLEFLIDNVDQSPYLLHAGAMALRACTDESTLANLVNSEHIQIRRALSIVLHGKPGTLITRLLNDPDPAIVRNAIITINNRQLHTHYEAAAALLADLKPLDGTRPLPDKLTQLRLINLNFKLGTPEAAQRLWNYAAAKNIPVELQATALRRLELWQDHMPIDFTTGWSHPRTTPPIPLPSELMRNGAERVLATGHPNLHPSATKIANEYDAELPPETLVSHIENDDLATAMRITAMRSYSSQLGANAANKLKLWTDNPDPTLASTALAHLATTSPEQALPLIHKHITNPDTTTFLRQEALRTLALMDDQASATLLTKLLESLKSGTLDNSLHVELLEVVESRPEEILKTTLNQIKNTWQADENPLTPYLATLEGGDTTRGLDVFYNHGSAQCIRCHTLGDQGSEVGPALDKLAERMDPTATLQSLVDPSAQITPGYGNIIINKNDNSTLVGIYQGETDQVIHLTIANENQSIPKNQIKDHTFAPSPMPPVSGLLTPREMRDLVAFLQSLDNNNPSPGPTPITQTPHSEASFLLNN